MKTKTYWCFETVMIRYHREGYLSRGLHEFCKMAIFPHSKGNRLAEIGSHAGESAEIFSQYFREVYCVDTWQEWTVGEKVFSSKEVERSFDERMRDCGNIVKLKTSGQFAAVCYPDNYFDGVYIDADRDYEGVCSEIEAWKPKAAKFIGGHDWVDGAPEIMKAVVKTLGVPHYLFEDYSWLVFLDRIGPLTSEPEKSNI